ncbi:hypothetical protein ACS3SW_12405 [Roseobacteraceae bacterium S113]
MTIAHLLEDFGKGLEAAFSEAGLSNNQEAQESVRLEAYEDGYKAGWDDAVGANQAEQMQVAADLAQNLRDMSFTYQEACTHVSKSLHGVFDAMMSLFLPEVARVALAPKVGEYLQSLPLNSDNMNVVLSVAPESKSVMARLVDMLPDIDCQILEDTALTAGQVVIGLGDGEVSIDFDALLQDMRATLEAFKYENQEEAAHG